MKDKKIRFGPAGVPIQCEGTSTIEGVACCSKIGLDAMEMEFVRGVRLKDDQAKKIKKIAEEKDIVLSSHAPYFVNLCSKKEETKSNSKRHIYQAANATFLAGGRITVFHPGYYQDLNKEEAYTTAKKNLQEIQEKLDQNNIKCILGAETVGKRSQFGGLDEVIRLSKDLENLEPCIDFSHLVARGDFPLKEEQDYRKLFAYLEKELGDYVKHFHSHFQEVEYTDAGEKKHAVLGSTHEPPYKPFMKVLAENDYSGVIISESPQIDFDAIKMRDQYYENLKKLK